MKTIYLLCQIVVSFIVSTSAQLGAVLPTEDPFNTTDFSPVEEPLHATDLPPVEEPLNATDLSPVEEPLNATDLSPVAVPSLIDATKEILDPSKIAADVTSPSSSGVNYVEDVMTDLGFGAAGAQKLITYVPTYNGIPDHKNGENCDDPCLPPILPTLPAFVELCNVQPLSGIFKVPVLGCLAEKHSKYRTLDGSCNNILFTTWGQANICQRKFVFPDHADGLSAPRISCLKQELPNAREISNVLHKERKILKEEYTVHFMEWGQTVAHDVALTNTKNLPETGPGSCCDPLPRVDEDCIAVEVPESDTFYKGKHERKCLSFQRSVRCPLCAFLRHPLNENTAFLDLTIIYGNSEEKARSLRSGKYGKLRTQRIRGVGDLPPSSVNDILCLPLSDKLQCFDAGDNRITQNALLTVEHIMMLRNHNNICSKLHKLNPHWDDDKLFYEARRINIAQAQMITFGTYLQRVLGTRITREFELDVLPGCEYTKYHELLDPSIWDEYAAVAQRYGHTMVPNCIKEQDPRSGEKGAISLAKYFYYPFDFYKGQYDRLALGMTCTHARKHDIMLASSVRNFLYDRRDEKDFEGSDLAATSIVRGRDHGIASYTKYLKFFFKLEIGSFCDLEGLIDPKLLKKLRKLYRSVQDVDLYVGALGENHMEGAMVGPTFGAILLVQYLTMKYGDRYYFEHADQAGSFTCDQLLEIKKTTLARILCETSKISKIQPDVFLPCSDSNKQVSCDSLPALNLEPWRE